MKNNFLTIIGFLLIVSRTFGQSTPISDATVHASAITADELKAFLSVIASDSMEGRETGTPGNDRAARYIAKNLKLCGLEPGGDPASYFQSVYLKSSTWNKMDIDINGADFRHLFDYITLPALNGDVTINDNSITFLGFGIDDNKWSDYKNTNVKGKIILIYEGEPRNADSTYLLSGTSVPSDWTTNIERKLKLAKAKGAAYVLIVKDRIPKFFDQNRNAILGNSLEPAEKGEEISVLANHAYISTKVLAGILGKKQKKFIKLRDSALANQSPKSMVLKGKFGIIQQRNIKEIESNNIAGIVRGSDPILKNEYVVLSAHMDHLGKRGDEIFYGADDDGSGTSSLLMLSKALAKAKDNGFGPKRSVMFLWFTGEEKGLLGSKYFVQYPTVPLSSIVTDLNIDMVGRRDKKYENDPNYIYVIGSDKLSSDLHNLSESVNSRTVNLKLDYTYNNENDPNRYYYRSDHYNFAKNNIPVIFYFNGTHADYHRPTDTIDKIDFPKMEKINLLVFNTMWELANRADRPKVDKQ